MRYLLLIILLALSTSLFSQLKPQHNLVFDSLPERWDEGIPLGNGWLGALIWKKGEKLRMSLDRVDLWDDRPMPEIGSLKFKWVTEKVKLNQYDSVQKKGDEPYEKYPAPTKIPGAALEFDMSKTGKVKKVLLDISNGLSTVTFENGIVLNNYIHATRETGYFSFENTEDEIIPELIMPFYHTGSEGKTGNSVSGQSLERLGYEKGTIRKGYGYILYHQPAWKNNYYEVLVRWHRFPGKKILGQWTITFNQPASLPELNVLHREPTGWPSHIAWWNDYWKRSSVSIPDAVLEKQYYLDMYKFGCVARGNTPPISLQAIWTADNGLLPPWKGDFHHDLNTELSYWPGYSGNHLDLTEGFTNWLWKIKEENKKWTKQYFETDGLNVPGVTTISGKPMGGWIQYSMSPTTSAWLAHHFYWQWKYSMNKKFLVEKCISYFDLVEKYIWEIRKWDSTERKYKLPLSSTPEYNDNSIKAWFRDYTNYDLALLKFLYDKYIEILNIDTKRSIKEIVGDSRLFPDLYVNEKGIAIAKNQELEFSHRHQNHLLAIHPLGLLNPEDSIQRVIIENSLRQIEKLGTREWVGYSFAWIASIYARAKNGDSAVVNLKKFATNFVSSNSFHLNGDQKGGQYTNATYRPFTLEGNFAFAQGIHEMLLQSHKDFIDVFPAVPFSWKNVSFKTLRAEGAFLISAKKENGVPLEVKIKSEAGGLLRIKLPFKTWINTGIDRSLIKIEKGIAEMKTSKGQTIVFRNAFE
jgi:alpha-L-fucosidase 2